MKKWLCLLLCALLTVGCGTSAPKYDYTVPEKEKTDSMFDIAALQSITPKTEKTAEYNAVDGYLMEGMPYDETKGLINQAFFWVGKPTGDQPKDGWPAVLLIHGGGGNAFADWVEFWNGLGYVALALDVGGQKYDEFGSLVPNPAFYCQGSWGSVSCGTDESSFRKSWTYMNICNAVLAHNFLRALPYVNENKTVATGISWGGFLTCILSGLDKRFQAFAPVYGCGNLDTDSWGLTTAGLAGLDDSRRAAWKSVYDPSAYLPYSTKPMLFVSGMTDHAFSPVSHKKSTAEIPGKVFYAYSSSLAHGHYWTQTPCVEKFFDHILNGTKPAINFLSASYDNGAITLELEDAIDGAVISYTTSVDSDSHKWQWQNEEITLTKGINIVSVPAGATAAMIVGYTNDSNYAMASTDVFFTGNPGDYI